MVHVVLDQSSLKKLDFWDRYQSPQNHALGLIPQVTGVVISKQHFYSSGITSQNLKFLLVGSDA